MNDHDQHDTTPPSTGTKGYGVRTLTETFDDLAEGLYVTIRNPSMMPAGDLAPKRDLTKIKDRKLIEQVSNEWLASFVVDWMVYDVTDLSDDPRVLGEPCGEEIARCPSAVTSWILKKIQEVSDPR